MPINGLSRDSKLTLAITAALFAFLVIACIGGSSAKCTGNLVVNGVTYSGYDKNEADAKRNTCAKYCIEGDPQMEAMYRIWLNSRTEKQRKRVRKGVKGKWDALYADERIKRYVESCERRCLNERSVAVTCSK